MILGYVLPPDKTVAVFNPQEAISHRFMLGVSFACFGFIVGLSTLISTRFSARYNYTRRFSQILVSGVLVGIITMIGLHDWLADVSHYYDSVSEQMNLPNVLWSVSMVPLYKISLWASCVVLLIGGALCMWSSNAKA